MKKSTRALNALLAGSLSLALFACSAKRQIAREAFADIIDQSSIRPAHVGIAVFDVSAKKYLFNYQGDKYFIPASNTKLFTLYAALKYLGDSLIAARLRWNNDTLFLQATGDPTFMHPDFKDQPLLKFLQQNQVRQVSLSAPFPSEAFGEGWAWDDYLDTYMPERAPFPIYGDIGTITFNGDSLSTVPQMLKQFVAGKPATAKPWRLTRELGGTVYTIDTANGSMKTQQHFTLPMQKGLLAAQYLSDTLHKPVNISYSPFNKEKSFVIHSQPKDSLLKIMMHRSDNFFAEQTLLMTANGFLGEMNDEKMIDTLLRTDLNNLPQQPKWVDGSGLSRYNLFSPFDFVTLLDTLQNNYGLNRLKVILPGADNGTLEGLYKGYEGFIFAKTGTLSNNIALSGYLVTRKNKELIFSILVNNHQASTTVIRKQFETFLTTLINRY